MNGKAEASLKQLASLSQSLNQASDELSKQIAALDSALNSYKFGIWAWVKEPILTEFDLSEPDKDGRRFELNYNYRLGYGKHQGKWGLLIESGWDHDEEGHDVIFLRDAPRDIRLRAMEKMPALIESIVSQVSAVTEEATQKAAKAKELATALAKKPR